MGATEKVESGLWRARIHYLLGDLDAVRDELAWGTGSLLAVPPGERRQELLAELRATRAATGAPRRLAIPQLSRALKVFRADKTDWRVPGTLLQRALAFRSVGDSARAEADLREALRLLRERPAGDARRELWLTPRESTSSIYDQLVGLELARGNEEEAFRWVERAHERARSFAGAPAGAPSADSAPSFAELARQIDPGTVLLAYALLPERAVAWRIDSRGGRLIELGATSKEIESWSRALDADLAAGEWTSSSAQAARRLYRALIAPAGLDEHDRLVVVPDKELAGVPFAALIDDGGHFQLEQRVTEISTSPKSYVASRARWLELDGETASAFVIGDPTVDPRAFPGLARLPGAVEEARRVAALYPGSTLATGAQATRRALLEAIGDHAVVHIAAHALVDDSNPQHSALALAPASREEPGALFAEEISELTLPRTRTIVLAACGSSGGPSTRAEARMSLATAFLSADVPTVVGALWPVSDRRSVELLTGLHSRLRAGDDPAVALRSAQLGLLSSADADLRSPATWALFQALGG
jgi:CHAT domain-containing protein